MGSAEPRTWRSVYVYDVPLCDYDGSNDRSSPTVRERSTYDLQSSLRAADFTGKERDTESGLDFFGARYFSEKGDSLTRPTWVCALHHIGNTSF